MKRYWVECVCGETFERVTATGAHEALVTHVIAMAGTGELGHRIADDGTRIVKRRWRKRYREGSDA